MTADSLPDKAPNSWLWYGWFLDRDGRSNLSRPLWLGQGIKFPRQRNIAHYMHPIKQFRRSIARPKWTAPLYPDVHHGVAVGRPWRFCFIVPIAPAHVPRSSSPLMPLNQRCHRCRHHHWDRGGRRRRLTNRMEEDMVRREDDMTTN